MSRQFGIEIEFCSDNHPDDVVDSIAKQGIDCYGEDYNHEVRDYWKVITDSSIKGGSYGIEVVSPILELEPGCFNPIKRVLDGILYSDGWVDSSCGFHVHIGINGERPYEVLRFLRFYGKNEDLIDKLVSPDRRVDKGDYCQKIPIDFYNNIDSDLATFYNLVYRGRYYKVNTESITKYRTIEVRHCEGSLDYGKIVNWIKFVIELYEYCCGYLDNIIPRFRSVTSLQRVLAKDIDWRELVYDNRCNVSG